MERLTFEHEGKKCFYCGDEDGNDCECKVCSVDCAVCNPCPVEQTVIDHLAAYEDTGLTPEAAAQLKQIAEIFNYDPNDPAQLKQLCDKLRGWQQADQDGRLVVLPVPVGTDKVAYGLTDPDDGSQRVVTIECDYLEKLEIWDNPSREVVVEVDGWEIGESDIGKTVFLTRQEAEAAVEAAKTTKEEI